MKPAIPTFDCAEESFRDYPSKRTALVYLETAREYYNDGMIGIETMRRVEQDTMRLRHTRSP